MALYFKTVPEEFLKDLGEELKKVIKFKDKIVSTVPYTFRNFLNR
jgi:hypothetical protein